MNNRVFSENIAPLKSNKFKKIDYWFNGGYIPLCAKVSRDMLISVKILPVSALKHSRCKIFSVLDPTNKSASYNF
ncbi:MAG: hypothetical protein GQ532_14530 [Methylomarinum sp.]|nr:hypothetical protein [Methylomarinum sp.]